MKKNVSFVIACFLTFSVFPFSDANAVDHMDEKWDKFIKYDLCIADYDSLADSEKVLCEFIYDTEQSADGTIICERARRTLAGDNNLGERFTLEELQECNGIWDNYSETKIGKEWYTHCVPDIKHLDGFDDYNEYWLDDSGKVKIFFTGENSGTIWKSFKGVAVDLTYEEAHSYEYTECIKQEDGTYTVSFDIEVAPFSEDKLLCIGGDYSILPDGTILNDGDLYYFMPDNNAALISSKYAGGNELSDRVVVPDEIDGHPVTVIGAAAFASSNVKEIVLPNSIEVIERRAFANCENLESINYSDKIKYMGEMAFKNCKSLKSIRINSPELFISYRAFESCSELCKIDLNAQYIGDEAFKDCVSLGEVKFGYKAEKIGANAFANCINITNLTLPNTVRYIGQGAFIDTAVNEVAVLPGTEIIGCLPKARGVEARSAIEPPAVVSPLEVETICAFPSNCTILGYNGTEAEEYAKEWDLDFSVIGTLQGDANLDTKVTIADPVAILQHIANRDKYELKPQGLLNADVDGEAGVTANDARILQERDSNNFI